MSADDQLPVTADLATMSRSEYLSAARLVDDLEAARPLLDEALRLGGEMMPRVRRIVLVGSGGSYAALVAADYLLDQLTTLPVDVYTGNDLRWRQPLGLGDDVLFVLASFSGSTADVVDAMPVVTSGGGPTVAITGRADSVLATSCDFVLPYDGTAIYELPILLVLGLVAGHPGSPAATALFDEARTSLAPALTAALAEAPAKMTALASQLGDVDHVYVTGAGPMSGLALKLAPVLMENARIGATYYDASEMRHGPLEVLADQQPALLALLGTDESRSVAAGVASFWRDRGGLVLTIDAAELPPVAASLGAILVNPLTQWFVAALAARRGITDLDERMFMGKGLFSPGSWP